jgi:DNA polymerase III subunit delta'
MVGPDAELLLPWLEQPLRTVLRQRRAHALLVHGPHGVGQFELSILVARAWLCEAPQAADGANACGACASCRLMRAHTHPDLMVLLPEASRESLGWPERDARADDDLGASGKAKPSKEIKVEAVRKMIAFAQTTSARGRAKVVVVHPAESLNVVSANTLLKTLEEPVGDTRFLLSSAAPDALLPTVRSRCQALVLGLPPPALAVQWLAQQGVAQPEVLLAACGGQPLDALDWSRQGIDAPFWRSVPQRVRGGDASAFMDWPLKRLVESLQKVCHDAMCLAAGAAPRFFTASAFSRGADIGALVQWSAQLGRDALHAEHPWNPGLKVEALIQGGQRALASVHSAP